MNAVTSESPAQRANNSENVSIWWRHHVWKFYFQSLLSHQDFVHINSSLKLLSDHGMKSLNQIYIDLTYKTQVHNIDDQNTNVAETAHEALPLRTCKHFKWCQSEGQEWWKQILSNLNCQSKTTPVYEIVPGPAHIESKLGDHYACRCLGIYWHKATDKRTTAHKDIRYSWFLWPLMISN